MRSFTAARFLSAYFLEFLATAVRLSKAHSRALDCAQTTQPPLFLYRNPKCPFLQGLVEVYVLVDAEFALKVRLCLTQDSGQFANPRIKFFLGVDGLVNNFLLIHKHA